MSIYCEQDNGRYLRYLSTKKHPTKFNHFITPRGNLKLGAKCTDEETKCHLQSTQVFLDIGNEPKAKYPEIIKIMNRRLD